MKKIIGLILAFQLSVPLIFSCTNFLVGKKASTDGSTMISYSADSYNLYGELYHWPAMKYNAG
ncbi:MAG: dipeptidase, partial [Bacteroidales bacterium]|nr:dipeptidase [Bacteroidales bacterium]